MKKQNKSNKQTKALVQSRIPLKLVYFIWTIVTITRVNEVYPWMVNGVNYMINSVSDNYPTLYRYARLLKGLSLHKLEDLGLFSTSGSPEDSDDESEQLPVTRDYNVWYPFRPIPNVRTFKVQLSGFDWMFAMFGIRKRMKPVMEFEKFENEKFNRYMEFQLQRLENARVGKLVTIDNYNSYKDFMENTYECFSEGSVVRRTKPNADLYFRISASLVKYSTVFFVWQLSQTSPKWHRDEKLWRVISWYKNYNKICNEDLYRLNYHRTFIPKPNGKYRPLGVPTVPWRIRLGLWNKFLLKFLKGKISKFQHAYQPYRGTLSAWRQMSRLINYKNIYSVDLSKYFDKVSLEHCVKVLEDKGVPKVYANWFWYIHLSLPSNLESNEYEPLNKERQKVSEWAKELNKSIKELVSEREKKIQWFRKLYFDPAEANIDKRLSANEAMRSSKRHWPFSRAFRYLPWLESILSATPGSRPHDESISWFSRTSFVNNKLFPTWLDKDLGVPQGAPISPLLAIMALEDTVIKDNSKGKLDSADSTRVVGYSDDWLYFSNSETEPKFEYPEYGIVESKEKSHWVKRNGEWVSDLNFLGLSYDGKNNILRANTRSGSVIPYSKYGLMNLINYQELVGQPFCSYKTTGRMCDDCPSPSSCGQKLRLKSMCDSNWSVGGSTWKEMVNNNLFGFIQSRLYQGSWNLLDFKQDFRLTYCKKSWVDGPGRKWRNLEDLNVFTSTTFAFHSLIEILRLVRKEKKWITLENGHSYSKVDVMKAWGKATENNCQGTEESNLDNELIGSKYVLDEKGKRVYRVKVEKLLKKNVIQYSNV